MKNKRSLSYIGKTAIGKTAVAALALCLLILSVCSCTMLLPSSTPTTRRVTIHDILLLKEDTLDTQTHMETLSHLTGVPKSLSGSLLLTEAEENGERVVRVFDAQKDTLLYTAEANETVGFISSLLQDEQKAAGIYYVIRDDLLCLYNADGSRALETYYDADAFEWLEDTMNGFSYNGVHYIVRDGRVVSDSYDHLESEYFLAGQHYNGRVYYLSEDSVFVFDEKGMLQYSYTLPSYAEESHLFVLNNGNLLIQYTYHVFDGEEYDYIYNDKRHKIVSVLVNLTKMTESEQALPFLVQNLENEFSDSDFHRTYTDLVANVATVMDISNKRIDDNASSRQVVLSDGLLELYRLSDVIQGALSVERLSSNRYLATTAVGGLLVRDDCSVVGQLNHYQCLTEAFIVTPSYVFNHDLEVLLAMNETGYAFFKSVGDNLLLTKMVDGEVQLYLFTRQTEGEPRLLGKATTYVEAPSGFAMKEESGRFGYYSNNGERLLEAPSEIEWLWDDAAFGAIGYTVDSENNLIYYRLSENASATLEG